MEPKDQEATQMKELASYKDLEEGVEEGQD